MGNPITKFVKNIGNFFKHFWDELGVDYDTDNNGINLGAVDPRLAEPSKVETMMYGESSKKPRIKKEPTKNNPWKVTPNPTRPQAKPQTKPVQTRQQNRQGGGRGRP